MSRSASPQPPANTALNYEQSKRLAQDSDPVVRANLAARSDLRPELLYFLAEDRDASVRRQAAANSATPGLADLILAKDPDETVRLDLAHKIERLVPDLNPDARAEAQNYVIEVIEVLAKDQAVKVRRLLAEALSQVDNAPPEVIRTLARDAADVVACPVLEFSPLLADEDLLDIIEHGCQSGRLQAISRRAQVNPDVADAIMESGDETAITALLSNDNAQIREDALDRAIDLAPRVKAWQRPLVERPELPQKAMRKLAGFIEKSLLDILAGRQDLDRKTAKLVAKEVGKRLKEEGPGDTEEEDPALKAKKLMDAGELTSEAISDAVMAGERGFVRHALALKAGIGVDLVDRFLSSKSAKGITALAWKADCGMRLSTQLQMRMAGIAPSQVLHPRNDGDYPLSEEEMDWQWDFFRSLSN